jgi:hypothetical protein
LSWQHVNPLLVSVDVNNQPVACGLDYTVNGDSGTVTFATPIPLNSSVTVSYDYDTLRSTKTSSGSANIPLQLNYAASEQSSLFLQGSLQKQGMSKLNLGMKTTETLGSLGMNGQFMYSALSNGGSDAADRFAAILHSALTPDSRTHITMDWTDAGKNFDNSGNSAIAAGDNHIQIAATETLSKQLTTSDTAVQDIRNGVTQSTNTLSIAAAPDKHVSFLVTQKDTDSSNGPKQSTDVITVTAAPAKNLNMTATQTDTSSSNGPDQSTNVVAVNATPDPHLKIGANLIDTSTGSQTASVNAQAGLSKEVNVTASAAQSDQPTDHNTKQNIAVNIVPNNNLQVAGAVSTVTDNAVTAQVTSVSTSFQPISQIKVDAGYEDRNASANDTNAQHFLDTTRVQVTITPAKDLSLTGKYGENVDDGGGNPQPQILHGVSVQSKVGSVSLQSGCNWTQSTTTTPLSTTQLNVGVGVHMGHSAISANYTGSVVESPSQSTQQTQTYTLSFNHSLTNKIQLSVNGSMTQATTPNSCQISQNYTTTANLGMRF